MAAKFSRESLPLAPSGAPLYEQLAAQVEKLISNGALADGERLPTVRRLAKDLHLSGTTITSAFALLSKRGFVRAEVGRGTFVTAPKPVDRPAAQPEPAPRNPWRKRTLTGLGARLRRMYPGALDCSTGRPDPDLLPVASLRRAWQTAVEGIDGRALQYASPEMAEALAAVAVERLASDNIRVREPDLIAGNSAQQLMTLALRIVAARRRGPMTVAVEEPGYPTILDAFEKEGAALCGVAVDEDGAVPASLEAALRAGAQMVLLTPRAQNPTGASWSPQRLHELAGVLSAYPEAVVVEDDHLRPLLFEVAGA
jgi:DNA-binding transcriptional MocR family regulator